MKLNQWSNDGENELADLCRVLSEPFRVRLLRLLGGFGERTVADLCVSAQSCRESVVSQPLVSHHLTCSALADWWPAGTRPGGAITPWLLACAPKRRPW